MCHHYPGKKHAKTRAQKDALTPEFSQLKIRWWEDFPLSPAEIYPGTRAAILRLSDSGHWVSEERIWGLVPPAWKPPKGKGPKSAETFGRGKFNARSETIDTTWPWKISFGRRQRCVIVAEGFCEPRVDGKNHQDEWLYTIPDQPVIALAGLWETFSGDNGKGRQVQLETFTMLTTEANSLVAATRKPSRQGEFRQPVVLTTADEIHRYCSPEISERNQLKDLFVPYPADGMLKSEPPE